MVSAASSPLPETVLRPRWSVPVLGMLFTAPTSGLCGVSLPGLVLLTARGQKGTGGAFPGCGPWPGAATAEAGEARERERRRKSRLCGQHPPPSAGRESLPLWVRKEPSSQSAAGQAASVHPGSACVTPSAVRPRSAQASEAACVGSLVLYEVRDTRVFFEGEDSQATGFSEEEEGQEEGRRKKHLTRQILPAVPRARAAVSPGPSGPCHPSCASRSLPAPLLHLSLFHAAVISAPPPTPFLYLSFILLSCSSVLPFSLSLSCPTAPFSHFSLRFCPASPSFFSSSVSALSAVAF